MVCIRNLSVLALATTLVPSLAQAQLTERVTIATGGVAANFDSYFVRISANGRFVAFKSDATNLVPGDTNLTGDVFVRDRLNGTTERVSLTSTGLQANGDSSGPALSAEGRFVVFFSAASNLVPGDTNFFYDVFVRDRLIGTTVRASVSSAGVQGNADSMTAAISDDGRYVAFTSSANNLVTGDTNGNPDIFVRDLLSGTTERVSLGAGALEANSDSAYPSISGDGRCVSFISYATNLVAGDTNGCYDVFVRDRLLGTTERVSLSTAGIAADQDSYFNSISADGRFVAFDSLATDLVAGDTNGFEDVFVHDRQTGATQRVSVASGGVQGNSDSISPWISGNGRCVAFQSLATNLVAGDTNGFEDIFVHDLLTGTTERVSLSTAGAQGDGASQWCSISGDARCVAFESLATDLVAGDSGGWRDGFVRDRGSVAPIGFCFGDGSDVACPCGNNGAAGLGCENSAGTGGALLAVTGNSSLGNDTLVLASSGELPSEVSIFLQGTSALAALHFGDGLRCAGGNLKRLYVKTAAGGSASAPVAGEPPISARSAALGDALTTGATRYYQTYYRDSVPTFCPSPQGNTWNVSSGLAIVWSQ